MALYHLMRRGEERPPVSSVMDLYDIDMSEMYKRLSEDRELGRIPEIARAYVGRNPASSFNERVNSIAKVCMLCAVVHFLFYVALYSHHTNTTGCNKLVARFNPQSC